MAEFNFKEYLFNKGFSFTNEGKEQFSTKKVTVTRLSSKAIK